MIFVIGQQAVFRNIMMRFGTNARVIGKIYGGLPSPGAAAWPTATAARNFLDENKDRYVNCSIYAVDADFVRDTLPADSGRWSWLLHIAPIMHEVSLPVGEEDNGQVSNPALQATSN